ncbi:hypothetical protein OEA41_010895 [Lepraria neglecta]|uniref:Uncharacterized protein n=1 Tax=Lepraria neglecta TaxID=209136 RepID=A0AAD9YYP3_9LECA|nr:hypothetical protein OEA41_010895 [Lepraria neglecta]
MVNCIANIRLTDDNLDRYWEKFLDLVVASDGHPTLLGIGAGGSIIQHIERDENDPRIWDVANSKILNVQIIDSTTFRSLTGLNSPRTPINAQMYKQMGLPFYSLWRDEGKEDGVASAWGGLVGVAEVASKSRKRKQEHTTPVSEGSEEWGLLNTGAWGLLGSEEENTEGGGVGAERGFKEQSFEFPIVLLDVDDTLPKFRSVAEPEESDEVWEDMEGEDNS